MNYRHIYHAGGFADVVKHAVLALLLQRFAGKDTPFCAIDTHAGIGCYDLLSNWAQRTGEHHHGIRRLWTTPDPPAALAPYLAAVAAANPDGGLRWYPGSPEIARGLLRPNDRLVLCELHPEEWAALRQRYAADRRIAVHQSDGYLAFRAFLPPKERRGLVLVDPPFERSDEFERLAEGALTAHRRWPGGLFALWYPIKDRSLVERFQTVLAASGIRKILGAELLVQPPLGERLAGCGMVLINPPWRIEEALGSLLPWLARVLAQTPGGGARNWWIVPE